MNATTKDATKAGVIDAELVTGDASLVKPNATPAQITTPQEFRASLTRWQEGRFHVLTPAANFSGLPPQHVMVAAMVQVNPSPAAGEVYFDPLFCKGTKDEPDELVLAKIALSRIAQAAGMTIKTERTDPRTIPNYWEVRATVVFVGLDGTPQALDATAEYDLRDGSPRIRNWSDKQKLAARTYGLRGCEARAINAAIRQFGIKQKYTVVELAKPFVCVRVMFQPDMSDPETRRLVTERSLQGTTALYGAARALPGPEPLDTIGVGADEPRQVGAKTVAPAAGGDGSGGGGADDAPPTEDAVRVERVETKDGETKGRKWTRYTVIDSRGETCSTFDKHLAEAAAKAQADRVWVELTCETQGNYRNLIEISPAGQQPRLDLPDPSEL